MKEVTFKIFFVFTLVLMISMAVSGFKYPDDDKIKTFNKSLTDEKNKDYQNAVNKILSIYDSNKSDYLLNLRLGWLYYKLNKFKDSQKYYTLAFEFSGNKSVEALLGLTLPLSSVNDWDKVKEVYKQILSLDAKNYTANLYLGQILMNKGDYKNADTHLKLVYENFPGTYDAVISYAWIKFYLKDFNSAKDLFNRALMINANDSSAIQGLKLIK